MSIWKKMLKVFRGAEAPVQFPYRYARTIYTKESIGEGVFDEFQKQIQIIKNNKIVDKIDYTDADVQALQKVYNIPYIDMTKLSKPEYNFIEAESFGEITEMLE